MRDVSCTPSLSSLRSPIKSVTSMRSPQSVKSCQSLPPPRPDRYSEHPTHRTSLGLCYRLLPKWDLLTRGGAASHFSHKDVGPNEGM